MNKSIFLLSYVALGFLLITACKPDQSKQQQQGVMPSVTGKSGELIVVMDTLKFNSNVGLPIRKKLSSVFKGLPQPEPIFSLINIPHKAFNRGFQTHRNILRINVGENYTESRFVVRKNVFSKPQILIEAQAPNDSALKNLFQNRGDDVAQRFIESEWNRYIKLYKGMQNRGAREHLRKKFGVSLIVPNGYKVDKDTTNFTWLAREAPRYSQGILIYKYPYAGERTFTLGYQIQIRNRFTKKFVPGSAPNSFMITESMVKPFFTKKTLNNHTVYVMRGLWKVKNDFIGGPFICYSIFDENTGNVINVDGFVYAPRFEKRDYVRQIEAILQTLKLAG